MKRALTPGRVEEEIGIGGTSNLLISACIIEVPSSSLLSTGFVKPGRNTDFQNTFFQVSQTPQECDDVVNMGVIIIRGEQKPSHSHCGQHSLLHVLFANIWLSLSL